MQDNQTAAIAALYQMLKDQRDAKPTTRELAPVDRAAYLRDAKRRQRKREAEAKAAGCPVASDVAIRKVLSDAALLLLSTGGPGSSEITRALYRAFPGRSGVAGNVRDRCRAGTLKPTVLTADAIRAAGAVS